ncbi:MAG: sugar phosphate nucleotidyltransferase [Bacteroidota bacterium]
MKAFILAAGTGTRLRPVTDKIPKALIPVGGVPLLEIVIRRLAGAGFTSLVINVHHFSDQIREFVASKNAFNLDISFSDESNRLLDTGGAIREAKPLFTGEENILVHNVDILTNLNYQSLVTAHVNSGALATLAVKERPTTRNLLIDRQGMLCGWEYPDRHLRICTRENAKGLSATAFSGVYMLSARIFEKFPDEEVFGFIPWMLNLASTEKILTWDQSPAFWYEAGRPDSIEKASRELVFDTNHPEFILLK